MYYKFAEYLTDIEETDTNKILDQYNTIKYQIENSCILFDKKFLNFHAPALLSEKIRAIINERTGVTSESVLRTLIVEFTCELLDVLDFLNKRIAKDAEFRNLVYYSDNVEYSEGVLKITKDSKITILKRSEILKNDEMLDLVFRKFWEDTEIQRILVYA